MIGGISGVGPVYGYNRIAPVGAIQIQQSQKEQAVGPIYSAGRPNGLETPVQPVEQAKSVSTNASGNVDFSLSIRQGADPAEMAVRMRIRYVGDAENEMLGADPLQMKEGTKSPQEVMEESKCQTCEERKYQDGSDDPGVSFKTPGHIDPGVSGSVVRGHEMEHVVRERAQAEMEDRKVVQQSVGLRNAICPECGRVYVSGGTTSTTTVAQSEPAVREMGNSGENEMNGPGFDCLV